MRACGRIKSVWALALCCLGLGTAPYATAQPLESLLLPGEAGLFFDAAGTQRVASIPLFGTFDLYLVARVPSGGLAEYELVELLFRSAVLIGASSPALPSPSAFEPHLLVDACSSATGADPHTCPADEGEIVALVHYRLVRMSGEGQVCLGEFQCPTIAGPVAVDLRYRSCASPHEHRQFEFGRFACFSLDGTVAAAPSSWTTTKGWFGRSPQR